MSMMIAPYRFSSTVPVVTGAPQYVDSTTATGTATPVAINYPSGLFANDIALLILVSQANSGAVTHTTPSGWTLKNEYTLSTEFRLSLWWRRIDGTEGASVSITMSAATNAYRCAMLAYRGCINTGDPIEGLGSASRTVASTLRAGSPFRQTTSPDRTLVNIYQADWPGASLGAISPAADFTQRVSSPGSTSQLQLMVSDKALTRPGWFGEEVSLASGSSSTIDWRSVYFALVPQTEISSSTPAQNDNHLGSVVLLSSFDDKDTAGKPYEAARASLFTKVGTTAEVDTAQSKFGGSSLLCTSGGLTIPDSNDFAFGSSPFTVETWVRFATAPTSGIHYLFAQYDVGANQRSWGIGVNAGTLTFYATAAGNTTANKGTAAWAPSTGVWYHVAADFDGTTYRLYVDGVVMATATGVITLFDSTAPVSIGCSLTSGNANGNFNGWLDEVRITKGVARYAGAFTPPAAAFPRN